MANVQRAVERTCISCRRKGDKREFARFVKGASGTVSLDDTGKAPGRGAYICRSLGCLDQAAGRNRLAQALRTKISEGDWERLRKQACASLAGISD